MKMGRFVLLTIVVAINVQNSVVLLDASRPTRITVGSWIFREWSAQIRLLGKWDLS